MIAMGAANVGTLVCVHSNVRHCVCSAQPGATLHVAPETGEMTLASSRYEL